MCGAMRAGFESRETSNASLAIGFESQPSHLRRTDVWSNGKRDPETSALWVHLHDRLRQKTQILTKRLVVTSRKFY